jgi:hypothetical protein
MRNKSATILVFSLTALALGLLVSDVWLAMREARYSQLRKEYECGYGSKDLCKADFDGDGLLTHIDVRRHYDRPVELPPTFVGSEQEVVLNVWSIDNTWRTHVAVRNESGHSRLIIYDGTRWPGHETAVNAVYAWNGKRLSEVAPGAADKEILSAMAADDDAGTLHQWVTYHLLAWPGRLVYVLLFVVAALIYRKNRLTGRDSTA